jgi:4-amino-4-deoxy-L-arabinose transferase-like glycosyltransferase
LLVATLGLAAFKLSDLSLPYFWDEMGVYANGALYQFHHSISLNPSSTPTGISRGHPLLLFVVYALLFKLFGCHIFIAHTFALLITIIFIWTVFVISKKYFNPAVALLASLIFCIQPIILAQSALVQPEVPLALFIFLALYLFIEQKWIWYTVVTGIAFMLKETAVVIIFVSISLLLFEFLRGKNKIKQTLKAAAITLLPLSIYVVFIIVQKTEWGWFFYPYHLNLVSFKFSDVTGNYFSYEHFIFFEQGRTCWSFICLAAIGRWLYIYFKEGKKATRAVFFENKQTIFLLTMALIIIFTMGYCVVFIQLMRYSLMLIAPFAVITAQACYYVTRGRFLFFIPISAVLLIVPFFYLSNGNFNYDADMGYKRELLAIQQTVNYSEALNIYDKKIYTQFPYDYALEDTDKGYLGKKEFKVTSNLSEADYVICSSPSWVGFEPNLESFNVDTLKVFKQPFSTVYIFRIEK